MWALTKVLAYHNFFLNKNTSHNTSCKKLTVHCGRTNTTLLCNQLVHTSLSFQPLSNDHVTKAYIFWWNLLVEGIQRILDHIGSCNFATFHAKAHYSLKPLFGRHLHNTHQRLASKSIDLQWTSSIPCFPKVMPQRSNLFIRMLFIDSFPKNSLILGPIYICIMHLQFRLASTCVLHTVVHMTSCALYILSTVDVLLVYSYLLTYQFHYTWSWFVLTFILTNLELHFFLNLHKVFFQDMQ